MKKTLLLIIFILISTSAFSFGKAPADDHAKDFSLKALDGRTVSLVSLKGHVVLLAFFTTWCPSCQDEMPQLETLFEKYRSREFEVVGVNIKEDSESVLAFANSNKLKFTILLDRNGRVATDYQVRYIPRIFIINKEGKIAFKAQYMPLDQIEKELLKILK